MHFTTSPTTKKRGVLDLIRQWIETIEISNLQLARLLSQLIPNSCPFERDIQLLGHNFHIPPLCKLNPFYESLMILRFRALNCIAKIS